MTEEREREKKKSDTFSHYLLAYTCHWMEDTRKSVWKFIVGNSGGEKRGGVLFRVNFFFFFNAVLCFVSHYKNFLVFGSFLVSSFGFHFWFRSVLVLVPVSYGALRLLLGYYQVPPKMHSSGNLYQSYTIFRFSIFVFVFFGSWWCLDTTYTKTYIEFKVLLWLTDKA